MRLGWRSSPTGCTHCGGAERCVCAPSGPRSPRRWRSCSCSLGCGSPRRFPIAPRTPPRRTAVRRAPRRRRRPRPRWPPSAAKRSRPRRRSASSSSMRRVDRSPVPPCSRGARAISPSPSMRPRPTVRSSCRHAMRTAASSPSRATAPSASLTLSPGAASTRKSSATAWHGPASCWWRASRHPRTSCCVSPRPTSGCPRRRPRTCARAFWHSPASDGSSRRRQERSRSRACRPGGTARWRRRRATGSWRPTPGCARRVGCVGCRPATSSSTSCVCRRCAASRGGRTARA